MCKHRVFTTWNSRKSISLLIVILSSRLKYIGLLFFVVLVEIVLFIWFKSLDKLI